MNLGETRLSDIISFNQLEKLLKNYSLTSGLDVALYDPDGEERALRSDHVHYRVGF